MLPLLSTTQAFSTDVDGTLRSGHHREAHGLSEKRNRHQNAHGMISTDTSFSGRLMLQLSKSELSSLFTSLSPSSQSPGRFEAQRNIKAVKKDNFQVTKEFQQKSMGEINRITREIAENDGVFTANGRTYNTAHVSGQMFLNYYTYTMQNALSATSNLMGTIRDLEKKTLDLFS